MDCLDSLECRRRLYWDGRVNLAEFDPDAQQELEDRTIIDDDSEPEFEDLDLFS